MFDFASDYETMYGMRTPTYYEQALLSINRAYDAEDYDAYERRIKETAGKFGKSEWQVEDDATDVRLFGIDGV